MDDDIKEISKIVGVGIIVLVLAVLVLANILVPLINIDERNICEAENQLGKITTIKHVYSPFLIVDEQTCQVFSPISEQYVYYKNQR